MGDVRYVPHYEAVRTAPRPLDAIRALEDDDVVAALAAAAQTNDPYLANVLATEAQNRMRRARIITATLGEGVFAMDTRGHTTFLNPTAERLLGWTRDELLGQPFHPRVHPHVHEEECHVLRVLRTGRPHAQAEDAFETKDGRRIPVDYTATPILREGEVIGTVVVFRDTTERKRAEAAVRESEARLRHVVSNLPVILFALDRAGVFTLSEGIGLEAVGLLPGQLVSRSVFEVYRDDAENLAAARRALRGDSFRVDVETQGRIYDMHYSAVLDAEGRPNGAIGVAFDVTERRKLERDAQARVAFERAVGRISSHLVAASDWDEAANATLDELRRATDADRAHLFLIDGATGRMSNTHERCAPGMAPLQPLLQDLPVADFSRTLRTLEAGKPARIRDTAAVSPDDAGEFRVIAQSGVTSALMLPLSVEGVLRGFVALDYVSRERSWREEDEALLTIAARLLATAQARHLAVQALRANEARLERIVETLVEGVVLTDAAGNIVLANPAAERILGLGRGVILGRTYDAPEWRNFALDGMPLAAEDLPIASAIRTRRPVRLEHRLVKPDGKNIILSVAASPIFTPEGELRGVVASFDDVTERRAAEASASRLAAIVEASLDGIVGKTLDGIITSWNKGAQRLYGYSPDEIVGKHISLIVPPERRGELDRIMERLRAGRNTERLETERLHKDGSRIQVEVTVSPVFDASGRIVAGAAVQHDIRERKRIEAALRESEARYRSLFQAAGLGVVFTRPDGRLVEVNEAFAEMLGYTPEELVGVHVDDVTHPDDAPTGRSLMQDLFAGRVGSFQIEKRYLTKDGRALRARITVSVYREASGRVQFGIGLVESLEETQPASRRSEKRDPRTEAA